MSSADIVSIIVNFPRAPSIWVEVKARRCLGRVSKVLQGLQFPCAGSIQRFYLLIKPANIWFMFCKKPIQIVDCIFNSIRINTWHTSVQGIENVRNYHFNFLVVWRNKIEIWYTNMIRFYPSVYAWFNVLSLIGDVLRSMQE